MSSQLHADRVALVPPPIDDAAQATPSAVASGTRRSGGHLVPRERLVRALAGHDVPLRVLQAPAGYGKTTVLEQWAERDPRPFAWLTADRRHADPVRLLADIVRELDAIGLAVGGALSSLMTPQPAIPTLVMRRLARALPARSTRFVLVVDEVEVLEQEAVDLLAALAAVLPPGCALALAARRETSLPLSRLRLSGKVIELGARDLAMTRGEAADLLCAAGVRVKPEQVRELVAHTEGWPAGLYLAALALRDQDDLAAAIARFAGDDRLVADFLRDELLSHLPPAEVRFLMRVSPLAELSGSLCDAVLGARGSGALLRDLARSNLLLTPLDRSDERFHCHTLLGEALRAELRRTEPAREAEVHRRASEWYDEHGDLEHAIEHAIASGDAAYAGRLIWRVAPGYVARGRNATVKRWLRRFTDEQLTRHPELALAVATVHMFGGDRDLLERWALIAGALLDDAPPRTCDGLEAGLAIMRATVARDGIARMGADAARAYALEPERSAWRALCCLLMGAADLLTGNSAEGRRWLEEGTRRGAMSAPSIQVKCQAMLALDAFTNEDWDEGARLAALARAQLDRVGLGEYPTCALVFAVSGLANAHRGRADAARRDIRDARRLVVALQDFTPFLEGATTLALARAELRLGDVLGARTLLAECERVTRSTPDAVVLQDWLEDAWTRAEAYAEDAGGGASTLTTAELRVLGFLPRHMTFQDIAADLSVSRNTVKTHAHALYRKLDASSRAEAVTRATQLGLLEP